MEWGGDEEEEIGKVGVSKGYEVQGSVAVSPGLGKSLAGFLPNWDMSQIRKAMTQLNSGYISFPVSDYLCRYLQFYLQSISCSQLQVSHQKHWPRRRPCARQQGRQTGTCWVLDRSADQDRNGSSRECHRGCARCSLSRSPRPGGSAYRRYRTIKL